MSSQGNLAFYCSTEFAGAASSGVVTNITGDYFAGFANQPLGQDLSALNFNNYSNGLATITIETVSTVAAVPEPSSAAVISLVLGGLFVRRRRS